ncbi:hypothetical protein [Ligilactobacillus sp.]|uniref:hypothetical protein n=1 Tax=Ligilactobacillus sp. TaxID=2767921 RepID=UPI002FE060CA
MNQTTPYQLERARAYRAESQQAIEYILSNDDLNKARLILKSIRRSINAEINLSDDDDSAYVKLLVAIARDLTDKKDDFSQLERIRNGFYKFIIAQNGSSDANR